VLLGPVRGRELQRVLAQLAAVEEQVLAAHEVPMALALLVAVLVLDGLLDSDLRPDQLLVEFHHRFEGMDKALTVDMIERLRSAGYALSHISVTGREFSFVLI